MKPISTKLTNLVSLEQSNHKPMGMCGGGLHRFVMELLQWQNVYKIGEDEVLSPPVVALRMLFTVSSGTVTSLIIVRFSKLNLFLKLESKLHNMCLRFLILRICKNCIIHKIKLHVKFS